MASAPVERSGGTDDASESPQALFFTGTCVTDAALSKSIGECIEERLGKMCTEVESMIADRISTVQDRLESLIRMEEKIISSQQESLNKCLCLEKEKPSARALGADALSKSGPMGARSKSTPLGPSSSMASRGGGKLTSRGGVQKDGQHAKQWQVSPDSHDVVVPGSIMPAAPELSQPPHKGTACSKEVEPKETARKSSSSTRTGASRNTHLSVSKSQNSLGTSIVSASSRNMEAAPSSVSSRPTQTKSQRSTAFGVHDTMKKYTCITNKDRVSGKLSAIQNGGIVGAVGPVEEKPESLWTVINSYIKSPIFDMLCGLVIIVNSAFLGIECEYSTTHQDPNDLYINIQMGFNCWYACELVLRVISDGMEFVQCRWNLFDLFLITLMAFEVFVDKALGGSAVMGRFIRTLRVLRVVRTLRIVRVLRYIREFRKMIFAIAATLQTLFWSLLLLVVMIYMFAICFTQAVADFLWSEGADHDEDIQDALRTHYGSLARSMWSLYLAITNGIAWGVVSTPLMHVHWSQLVIFLMFISISLFGVLNVVTAVFVESAMHSTRHYRDLLLQEKLHEKETYARHMREVFHHIDTDDDGEISAEELESFLEDENFRTLLEALEIDMVESRILFQLLDYDDSGAVDIAEFCEGCLRLKGEAKSFDIHYMLYMNHKTMVRTRCFMDYVENSLADLHGIGERDMLPPELTALPPEHNSFPSEDNNTSTEDPLHPRMSGEMSSTLKTMRLHCSCGSMFLDDAQFCRKCGNRRPNACICGSILKDDSAFCRKCGTARQEATKCSPAVEKQYANGVPVATGSSDCQASAAASNTPNGGNILAPPAPFQAPSAPTPSAPTNPTHAINVVSPPQPQGHARTSTASYDTVNSAQSMLAQSSSASSQEEKVRLLGSIPTDPGCINSPPKLDSTPAMVNDTVTADAVSVKPMTSMTTHAGSRDSSGQASPHLEALQPTVGSVNSMTTRAGSTEFSGQAPPKLEGPKTPLIRDPQNADAVLAAHSLALLIVDSENADAVPVRAMASMTTHAGSTDFRAFKGQTSVDASVPPVLPPPAIATDVSKTNGTTNGTFDDTYNSEGSAEAGGVGEMVEFPKVSRIISMLTHQGSASSLGPGGGSVPSPSSSIKHSSSMQTHDEWSETIGSLPSMESGAFAPKGSLLTHASASMSPSMVNQGSTATQESEDRGKGIDLSIDSSAFAPASSLCTHAGPLHSPSLVALGSTTPVGVSSSQSTVFAPMGSMQTHAGIGGSQSSLFAPKGSMQTHAGSSVSPTMQNEGPGSAPSGEPPH